MIPFLQKVYLGFGAQIPANQGLEILSGIPTTVTNVIYNDAGQLCFNGEPVAGVPVDLSGIQTQIDTLGGDLVAIYDVIDDLNAEDIVLQEEIDSISLDIANLQNGVIGGVISDIDLLKTDVINLRSDANDLRTNKANKTEVSALAVQKADINYVDTSIASAIATREQVDHLASKLVDTTGRTDASIPIYDLASDTYVHTSASILQGGVAGDIADLEILVALKENTTDVDYKIGHHSHNLVDIGDYVAPDVNKAYVDNSLVGKVDVSVFNTNNASIQNDINSRALAADLAAGLSTKADSVHTHNISDITGLVIPIPDRWSYVSPNLNIGGGTSQDIDIVIPAIRLYGVNVSITGFNPGQKLHVDFYGNSLKTQKQYSADFTDELSVDLAQAWIFRNIDTTLIMYCRLINEDSSPLTNINLSIVMEPF